MNTNMIRTTKLVLALVLGGAVSAQTINVEVDYMETDSHTHILEDDEVEALVQMFACHGLTLNIVVDDKLTHWNVMKTDNPNADFFSGNGDYSFETIKNAHFGHDSDSGWHYAVMGHLFALDGVTVDNGGYGEVGGDDFVVTLGAGDAFKGSPFDRAAGFAHELGHNLGLDHFPLDGAFVEDGSPIYASIMSYAYGFEGVRSGLTRRGLVGDLSLFKELDYSNGRLAPVLELALFESVGVGIRTTDWDCDGTIEVLPVQQQLDTEGDDYPTWCGQTGIQFQLTDQNDWDVVNENLAGAADAADSMPPRTIGPCPPVRRHGPSAAGAYSSVPQATLTTEACIDAEMYWVSPSGALGNNGSGAAPTYAGGMAYSSQAGVLAAGTILYFQPGTHSNGGGTLLFNSSMFLAGPGGAVISP